MKTTLLMGSILLAFAAQAMEILPLKNKSTLGVKINSVEYPYQLQKELTSGLTTRILFRLQLKLGQDVINSSTSEYAVKYDLWDEKFTLEISAPPRRTMKKVIASKEDVMIQLQSPEFKGIFGDDVPQEEVISIYAEVLLNPIEKDRMLKIRRWVAQNSVTLPVDPTGSRSLKSSGARVDIIFNAIFEQFTKGSPVAGSWKTVGQSRDFTMREAKSDK